MLAAVAQFCLVAYLSARTIASETCQEEAEGDACVMLQKPADLLSAIASGQSDCLEKLHKMENVNPETLLKMCRKTFTEESCQDAGSILAQRPWTQDALRAACGSFGHLWTDRMQMAQSLEARSSIGLTQLVKMEGTALDKALSGKWPFGSGCPEAVAANATNTTNATINATISKHLPDTNATTTTKAAPAPAHAPPPAPPAPAKGTTHAPPPAPHGGHR
jgi:hypothetical protein